MFMFNTKGFVIENLKSKKKESKEENKVKSVKDMKITGCNPEDVIQFYNSDKKKIDDITNQFNIYAKCKQEYEISSGYNTFTNSIYDKDKMYKTLENNSSNSIDEFQKICETHCNNESDCGGFTLYKYEDKIHKCAFVKNDTPIDDLILYDGSGSDFKTFQKHNTQDVHRSYTDTIIEQCNKSNEDSCFIRTSNNIRYSSHKKKELKVNNNEKVIHNDNIDGCSNICDNDPKCRGFSVYQRDNIKQCEYVVHDYNDFTDSRNDPEMIDNEYSIAFRKQTHLF